MRASRSSTPRRLASSRPMLNAVYWKIKHPNIKPLALRAGELFASFPKRTIAHVPREANTIADALSNRAIDEAR